MMVNQHPVLKIGIAAPEVQRQRVLDIAAGRRKRAEGEPRVWFPSLKTAAEVLDRNRELIRVICDESPGSVTELALRVGRKESNVSRSLKRLEAFGIVRLLDEGRSRRPIALARDFEIQVSC
mgnify:CR=1 FL=1